MTRYYVGQPQTWINDHGTQYHAGVNEYQPFTTGRTAQSAERKYRAWLKRSGWGNVESAAAYVIWDRTEQRYLDLAEPVYA